MWKFQLHIAISPLDVTTYKETRKDLQVQSSNLLTAQLIVHLSYTGLSQWNKATSNENSSLAKQILREALFWFILVILDGCIYYTHLQKALFRCKNKKDGS